MIIINFIKNFINKIENNNIPLSYFIISFLASITLRNFLELFSSSTMIVSQALVHFYLSYLALALTIIFLLVILIKLDIVKGIKLVFTGFFILNIVPILDLIISSGKGYGIQYLTPEKHSNLLLRFFTFFGDRTINGGITPGMKIEIFLVLCFFLFYFIYKKISILKSFINTFLIYTLIFFYCSLPYVIKYAANFLNLNYVLSTDTYILFYLLLIFFIVTYFFFKYKKEIFKILLKDIRPFRLLHYELMLVLGVVLNNFYFIKNFDFLFLLKFLLISIAILFAWVYSVMTNNIIDYNIDKISNKDRPLIKSYININLYNKISIVFLFLALLYSSFYFMAMFIIALFIGNYFLYSMPPFRFKRIPLLSKIFISLNSLSLIILGFLLIGGELVNFPKIIIWFFIIFFTLVINFIDIKDYKGDKHESIKTLPVIMGLKNSKRIIGIFFVVTYLSVYFLLKDNFLLLPLLFLSYIQFYLINKIEYKEKDVFLVHLFSLVLFIFYILFSDILLYIL